MMLKRQCPHELTFAYPGGSISVATPDWPTLDWLTHFLTPSFRIAAGSQGRTRIQLTDDLQWFDQLKANMDRGETSLMTCFTRDGSFASFPAVATEADGTCLFDDQSQMLYRIQEDRRHVELVPARTQTKKGRRKALLRVVREIASVQSIDRRSLPVHGSCFAMDGQAVMLCGPKRSGKTTLLMDSLRRGASFVSNDRVTVSAVADAPIAHGMPTIVNVRPDSLRFFPRLGLRYSTAPTFDRDLGDDLESAEELPSQALGAESFADDSRPATKGLTPRRFCWLLQRQAMSSLPLRSIVFPRIDSTASGAALESIGTEQALSLLQQSLLTPGPHMQFPEAFAAFAESKADLKRSTEDLCRMLVTQAACYVCRLGPYAYRQGLLASLAA